MPVILGAGLSLSQLSSFWVPPQFASWLSNGKILIIIGYAFGDDKVNDRITDALQQNQELKVLVLDPGSDVLWVESPFANRLHMPIEIEPRLQWLRGRFGNKKDTRKLLSRANKMT